MDVRRAGARVITSLFMSMVRACFGVGRDDIYIENRVFGATAIVTAKASLVFTTVAVNSCLRVPTEISPSMLISAKLSKPSGKLRNNQSPGTTPTVATSLTEKKVV